MLKINPQHVGQIYAAYVDNEIAPKATSPIQKFWAYGSVFILNKKAEEYLTDPVRVEQLTAMGIMTPDNMIDLDFLKEMTGHVIEKSGGKIEAMGLILDQSDVEKVYNIGRSFAQ